MTQTEQPIREKIDKLFEDFNDWDYQFRQSDYATNREQEIEMGNEGRMQLLKLRNAILSLLSDELKGAIPKEKKAPSFDFGPDGPPKGAAEEWQRMDEEFGGYNQCISDLRSNLKERGLI